MIRMKRSLFWIRLLACLCISLPAFAENWPQWRGPRGDGTSLDKAPTTWDGETGKNVVWKVALPGEGHSSPIVFDDRVFVTGCDPKTEARLLICLDRKTGYIIWKKEVLRSRLESKHALNSYASSTPSTDGELIYVTFLEVNSEQVEAPNVGSNGRMIYTGQMVAAAYDFDGNRKWLVRPGGFLSAHGFCSNPIPFEDKVIINGDHDGDSYIVALDKKSGSDVWKSKRRHQTRSYVTPLIREIQGKPQMVLSGSKCIASFDPRTGDRNWNVEGPTEQFVASMVFDGSTFFAVGGYPTHHAIAIRPNGKGDVSETHVAWHKTNIRCYVPSPVIVGPYFVVADDRGTANCFDRKTGERHWQTRLGKHYSPSLVTSNGLVYFQADDGITKLLRPGPKPDVVHENKLGEDVFSSPAISNGQLFIRGEEHLFCISSGDANAGAK